MKFESVPVRRRLGIIKTIIKRFWVTMDITFQGRRQCRRCYATKKDGAYLTQHHIAAKGLYGQKISHEYGTVILCWPCHDKLHEYVDKLYKTAFTNGYKTAKQRFSK